MAGQDGYEFIGEWQDSAAVKDALMSAGAPLGLVHVGGFAYASASVESGWIPSPIPAIYTDPDLLDYRKFLPLYGIEGQRPLNGSFFSENIEHIRPPEPTGFKRSWKFRAPGKLECIMFPRIFPKARILPGELTIPWRGAWRTGLAGPLGRRISRR
jgi:hypothetical protein